MLVYAAVERLLHIEEVEIDGLVMLGTSFLGILFNGVNLAILKFCFNGSPPVEE